MLDVLLVIGAPSVAELLLLGYEFDRIREIAKRTPAMSNRARVRSVSRDISARCILRIKDNTFWQYRSAMLGLKK